MGSPSIDVIWQETRVLKARVCKIEEDIGQVLDCCRGTAEDITSIWQEINILKQRITDIEGRLTTIEGDINTIKGDLIDIKNRLTTIEGELISIKNRLTTIEGQLGNFVTLNSPQTILAAASKIWDSTQVFNKVVQFNDMVGIGTAPALRLDVRETNGRMAFDGVKLILYDDTAKYNLLIGSSTGSSSLQTENIGLGHFAFRFPIANKSVAIGYGSMNSGTVSGLPADRNVAVGNRALQLSNSKDSVAIGYNAGITSFGDNNVAIGSEAFNSVLLTTGTIPNSEAVTGNTIWTGTQTAAFITSLAAMVGGSIIGVRFAALILNAPQPLSASTYANLRIVDASTVQHDTALFTFTGTAPGTATFNIFTKVNNAIAIGYRSSNTKDFQISIGTDTYTEFRANKLIVDIGTAPTNGQALVYDTSSAQYKPKTVVTSKRVTKLTTPGATVSPNITTTDVLVLDQMDADITINAPTGTPTAYQELMIKIKDNGTVRQILYNAIYRNSLDLPLIRFTVVSKELYLKFIYNPDAVKWDFIGGLNSF